MIFHARDGDLSPGGSGIGPPLPDEYRKGLLAIGLFGALSFVSAIVLFFYLTFRLLSWYRYSRSIAHQQLLDPPPESGDRNPDLSLGLPTKYFDRMKGRDKQNSTASDQQTQTDQPLTHTTTRPEARPSQFRSAEWNPFLLVIYSLILADSFNPLGFSINLIWRASDQISSPSTTCWAQGWFMAVGTLSSCGLLTTFSINTYLAIQWGIQVPSWAAPACILFVWLLTIFVPLIGIWHTNNGVVGGGWYVWEDMYCNVNSFYRTYQFWAEYIWVVGGVALTILLNLHMLISMWLRKQSSRYLARRGRSAKRSRANSGSTQSAGNASHRPSGYHPSFFGYTCIYVATIAPIGITRLVGTSGMEVPRYLLIVFGCIYASQGWLNVVLWIVTINTMSRQEIEDIGLDRYVRTPHERVYGNIVHISGGPSPGLYQSSSSHVNERRGDGTGDDGGTGARKWTRGLISAVKDIRGGGGRTGQHSHSSTVARSTSQESLRHNAGGLDNAIQLETVTTIIVETGSTQGTTGRTEYLSDNDDLQIHPSRT